MNHCQQIHAMLRPAPYPNPRLDRQLSQRQSWIDSSARQQERRLAGTSGPNDVFSAAGPEQRPRAAFKPEQGGQVWTWRRSPQEVDCDPIRHGADQWNPMAPEDHRIRGAHVDNPEQSRAACQPEQDWRMLSSPHAVPPRDSRSHHSARSPFNPVSSGFKVALQTPPLTPPIHTPVATPIYSPHFYQERPCAPEQTLSGHTQIPYEAAKVPTNQMSTNPIPINQNLINPYPVLLSAAPLHPKRAATRSELREQTDIYSTARPHVAECNAPVPAASSHSAGLRDLMSQTTHVQQNGENGTHMYQNNAVFGAAATSLLEHQQLTSRQQRSSTALPDMRVQPRSKMGYGYGFTKQVQRTKMGRFLASSNNYSSSRAERPNTTDYYLSDPRGFYHNVNYAGPRPSALAGA